MRRRHTTLLWCALVALVAAAYFMPARSRTGSASTYSAAPGGTRAFFELTARLFEDVGRSTESLVPHGAVDTLLIVAPAVNPTRRQWEELANWVARGHSLIFVASSRDPVLDLAPFPVRLVPSVYVPAPSDGAESGDAESDESPAANEELGTKREDAGAAHAEEKVARLPEPTTWRSWVEIEFDGEARENAEILLGGERWTHGVWLPVGDGCLVVLANESPLLNAPLAELANARFAARLVEAGNVMGPVRFDETLHAAGEPSELGLLTGTAMRPLAFQLLVVFVLYAWAHAGRFGGRPAPRRPPRRSAREHAEALGGLLRRHGGGGAGARALLEQILGELRGGASAHSVDHVQLLQRNAGIGREEARDLLAEIDALEATPHQGRAKGAALIRRVAALRLRPTKKPTRRTPRGSKPKGS